jgi:hypothetical protein
VWCKVKMTNIKNDFKFTFWKARCLGHLQCWNDDYIFFFLNKCRNETTWISDVAHNLQGGCFSPSPPFCKICNNTPFYVNMCVTCMYYIVHKQVNLIWVAIHLCRDLSLGLATKVRVCEGASQEWSQESHFMLSGVWESVREWTLTLPNELPHFKGQNPLDRKVAYIIRKLLESRCLKWVRMTHLDSWNISYGQKKDHKSNWQFDSRPLKVGNCLNFLAWRCYVTYH